ncbi:MAG TPA: CBS domain-containing protein [Phycisphaerae bacterium]|nr:CBS domain-containing protein [Phycisphaerae bacterium]
MFVCNHMTREPVCVNPAATLREVAQIMQQHAIRHVPVVNQKKGVLGIIGDRELGMAGGRRDFWEARAGEVMSHSPLTIESNAPLGRALMHLCAHDADSLLAVERGELVGILTREDLLRACSVALALDNDGGAVEVALDGIEDLVTAFEVLHKKGIEIRSAVAGRIRDDGDDPVLFVRLSAHNAQPVEKALAEAGLILLVPEEELLADEGAYAGSQAS